MRPDFDLQSHSTRSDGELEPAGVVAAAAAAGVRLLALSDHDTVDGVGEALAAARELGIGLVPAVEISTVDDDHGDLHVLGYRIDVADEALGTMLARSRESRDGRAARMAQRLRSAGLAVDETALEARRAAGLSIGRPHLAEAVLAHPANAGRLASEGLGDVGALIEAYLVPGRPGYESRWAPSVAEAIERIHAAGGVAVWAHPFWDLDAVEEVDDAVDRFAGMGLDGVEAFYVTHTREQTLAAARAAGRHRLLTTGSTDFHGPGHPRFNRFLGFETHGLTPRLGPIAGSA